MIYSKISATTQSSNNSFFVCIQNNTHSCIRFLPQAPNPLNQWLFYNSQFIANAILVWRLLAQGTSNSTIISWRSIYLSNSATAEIGLWPPLFSVSRSLYLQSLLYFSALCLPILPLVLLRVSCLHFVCANLLGHSSLVHSLHLHMLCLLEPSQFYVV